MTHDEIHDELAECRASGEFVVYHKWGDDPSVFLVGVVRELTPTKATFQDMTVGGQFESEPHGVPLRLIHTVHRKTQYLWRLRVLHDLGPSKPVEERIARTRRDVRALLEEAALAGHRPPLDLRLRILRLPRAVRQGGDRHRFERRGRRVCRW